MEGWAQVSTIIGVIVAVNFITMFLTNKRIDDLRSQMSREHDTLRQLLLDHIKNHA